MENVRTILAIETSCDETSVAVIRRTIDSSDHDPDSAARYQVLAHVTLSQIELHVPYGGVFPNLARREHETNITHVIADALAQAGLLQPKPTPSTLNPELLGEILSREQILLPIISDFITQHEIPAIDAIAVTVGPGLEPALWVGINTTRALATAWNLPVIPVNHMEGHILSCWAIDTEFSAPSIPLPGIALLISGGHTEFIQVNSWGSYQYLGGTVDDAIGEAFDKAARQLGLAYPGGPKISKLAAEFESTGAALDPKYELPRPMINSGDLRMSFSGIKTAVRYLVDKLKAANGGELTDHDIAATCYSFETAVSDVMARKTRLAIESTAAQSLIIGGGVAANARLRAMLQSVANEYDIALALPTNQLSTDNALMIAVAGIQREATRDLSVLVAQGNLQF